MKKWNFVFVLVLGVASASVHAEPQKICRDNCNSAEVAKKLGPITPVTLDLPTRPCQLHYQAGCLTFREYYSLLVQALNQAMGSNLQCTGTCEPGFECFGLPLPFNLNINHHNNGASVGWNVNSGPSTNPDRTVGFQLVCHCVTTARLNEELKLVEQIDP